MRGDLVSLSDLFGIATTAAGEPDPRDGVLILEDEKREVLFGVYGRPDSEQFKIMVCKGEWKYIYMVNGSREQLFHLSEDPHELVNLVQSEDKIREEMYQTALEKCQSEPGLSKAVESKKLRGIPYHPRKLERLHQFDFSKNIMDYSVPSGCNFMSQALFLEE